MEEIKVGEYIRTKSGNIGKVLDITNVTMQKRKKYLIKWNISKAYYITAIRIIKHSKDIIDLIEKNDYVNGCKVYEVRKDEIVVYLDRQPINCYNYIMADEIKSIITKEQIKQIEYRIKE